MTKDKRQLIFDQLKNGTIFYDKITGMFFSCKGTKKKIINNSFAFSGNNKVRVLIRIEDAIKYAEEYFSESKEKANIRKQELIEKIREETEEVRLKEALTTVSIFSKQEFILTKNSYLVDLAARGSTASASSAVVTFEDKNDIKHFTVILRNKGWEIVKITKLEKIYEVKKC